MLNLQSKLISPPAFAFSSGFSDNDSELSLEMMQITKLCQSTDVLHYNDDNSSVVCTLKKFSSC